MKKNFFSDLAECRLCIECGCFYYGPATLKQCQACDFDEETGREQRARSSHYRRARARQQSRG